VAAQDSIVLPISALVMAKGMSRVYLLNEKKASMRGQE
jgi:hypothetical protein